ncbi:MAG: hypothetical protein P8171_24340 [Candidatus Thiodiazotropha sp.]
MQSEGAAEDSTGTSKSRNQYTTDAATLLVENRGGVIWRVESGNLRLSLRGYTGDVGHNTICARDRSGRYSSFTIVGRKVWPLRSGIKKLGPVYGRVDFSNAVRFNGRSRSQAALEARFNAIPFTHKLTTGWVALPEARSKSRRETNQGMDTAMAALTGAACSATRYAIWCDGRNTAAGIKSTVRWEWCHLLAHSMGGADNATNIVAAVKGNNTEQLAIENTLQMYRRENMFHMKVTAACLNGADMRHMGDVIKYEIRCEHGGTDFVHYLDCLNVPAPSEIHYYDLSRSVATWANIKLVLVSEQVFGNKVSGEDARRIHDYM